MMKIIRNNVLMIKKINKFKIIQIKKIEIKMIQITKIQIKKIKIRIKKKMKFNSDFIILLNNIINE